MRFSTMRFRFCGDGLSTTKQRCAAYNINVTAASATAAARDGFVKFTGALCVCVNTMKYGNTPVRLRYLILPVKEACQYYCKYCFHPILCIGTNFTFYRSHNIVLASYKRSKGQGGLWRGQGVRDRNSGSRVDDNK